MLKKIVIVCIRFYKKKISPNLPPMCRFYPTCSSYALEALDKHGFIKGSALSIWRICRCNPFCEGGYDPVPEKDERRKRAKND